MPRCPGQRVLANGELAREQIGNFREPEFNPYEESFMVNPFATIRELRGGFPLRLLWCRHDNAVLAVTAQP